MAHQVLPPVTEYLQRMQEEIDELNKQTKGEKITQKETRSMLYNMGRLASLQLAVFLTKQYLGIRKIEKHFNYEREEQKLLEGKLKVKRTKKPEKLTIKRKKKTTS